MTGNNGQAGQALIYCRVSTSSQEQDGTSLDTQEAACRAHAERLGYQVVRVYRDVYSGAEILDRPELNALRDAIHQGGIAVVIIYAVDRLTRAQGLTAYLLAEFERRGTDLLSVTDPLDKTKEGKLILGIKEYVAEAEREKIRERTVRGKRAKLAENKLCHGSVSLYGYTIDPVSRQRVVHEPEAETVRLIFARAAAGLGLRAIARQLTAEGVPTRGTGKFTYDGEKPRKRRPPSGGWAHKCVRDILENPAYKGETLYLGQQLAEGVTPPIVSAEQWTAAQRRDPPNGPKPADRTRNEKRPRLLRGLVCCSVCGLRMQPSYIASRGHKGQVYPGHYYYQCGSIATPHGACGARSVRADLLEPAVWETVERMLREPEMIADELKRRHSEGPDQRAVDEIETARRRLAEIERQQKRLLELYAAADDAMPMDLLKLKLSELARQAQVWQQARERAEQQLRQQDVARAELEGLTAYCRRVAGNLRTFDFDERRQALEALDVRVSASGRDAKLEWSVPTGDKQAVPVHLY